jgi:hypothetical protein
MGQTSRPPNDGRVPALGINNLDAPDAATGHGRRSVATRPGESSVRQGFDKASGGSGALSFGASPQAPDEQRAMVSNRLLALTMIAPPIISFVAVAMRGKKTELVQVVNAISPENVPGGRYGSGIVLGQEVPAYQPATETYVALKLGINQGRPHTTIRH